MSKKISRKSFWGVILFIFFSSGYSSDRRCSIANKQIELHSQDQFTNLFLESLQERTNEQITNKIRKFTSSSAVCGLSSIAPSIPPFMHPSSLFGKENKDRLKIMTAMKESLTEP